MTTSERIQILQAVSKIIETEILPLSVEQLNQKPDAKSWSIAQVLHHLIQINTSYYPILEALENGTYSVPFHGKIGWLANQFGKMVLNSVQPDRKKKMKTFPIWEPSYSALPSSVVSDFILHQNRLIERMEKAEKWVREGCVICSPASRVIVYKLETAFDIITLHEDRHLNQIHEICHQLGFNKQSG